MLYKSRFLKNKPKGVFDGNLVMHCFACVLKSKRKLLFAFGSFYSVKVQYNNSKTICADKTCSLCIHVRNKMFS